jgi:hypothetical protein
VTGYLLFLGGRGKEKFRGTDPSPLIQANLNLFFPSLHLHGETTEKHSMGKLSNATVTQINFTYGPQLIVSIHHTG